MGTFLTYRLAGGEAGMRHFMAQFGPTLELPWTRLTDVPVLDEQLIDKVVAQSDQQAAGRSIEELVRIRDDCLVAVLLGLKGEEFGAGEVIARAERRLLEAAAEDPARRSQARSDGRLALHEAVVAPEWIDYNGHMTEYRYLEVLADGTDAFLLSIGIDPAYVATGRSYYTVETHLRHLAEGHEGDRLTRADTTARPRSKAPAPLPRAGPGADDTVLASSEHMLLHVERSAGATAPRGRRDPGGAGSDRGRRRAALSRPPTRGAGSSPSACAPLLRRRVQGRERHRRYGEHRDRQRHESPR